MSKEKAYGRIHYFYGFWRLHGNQEGKPVNNPLAENGVMFSDRLDELDRPMEMVSHQCLLCPLPKWEDNYAKYNNKYWIPARLCRKCEFHIKRRRGVWFACCDRKAAKHKGQAIAKELDSVWNNAIDFADSIMGKPSSKEEANE